jgi:SAM-dependent methyltransferase/FKBP-type peptidyl-prolyl cis-trans isomerase 2
MELIAESFLAEDSASDVRDAPRERVERTTGRSMVALEVALGWESEAARHTDVYVAQKVNIWRDVSSPVLEAGLVGKPIGHRMEHRFAAGELLEPYAERDCLLIPQNRFNRRLRRGTFIEPRAGRFYPKGFIAGVRDIYPEDHTPFRLAAIEGDQLRVELNHPLAGRTIAFGATILDAWETGSEHGGLCHDLAAMVTDNGPGMQARWRNQPTDFWSDVPFIRMAAGADDEFYEKPRLVDHIDRTATRQVERLYGRLLPKGGRILDLMTSWKSHLPAELAPAHVAGLGMNMAELEANPVLGERIIGDLNLAPTLPYDDASFDGAVCTVSVEYLVKPFEVVAEVARVLKPGARFIVSFSNRWFPPKVINIWQSCHEFERMGIVLEYFLRDGRFRNLETFSLRGLPRPEDDKYADQFPLSDPVYAVWGERA